MEKISKEEQKQMINKVVDLLRTDVESDAAFGRLFSFAFGLLAGKDVSFDEVYIAIRRAILTVEAVLEEQK